MRNILYLSLQITLIYNSLNTLAEKVYFIYELPFFPCKKKEKRISPPFFLHYYSWAYKFIKILQEGKKLFYACLLRCTYTFWSVTWYLAKVSHRHCRHLCTYIFSFLRFLTLRLLAAKNLHIHQIPIDKFGKNMAERYAK